MSKVEIQHNDWLKYAIVIGAVAMVSYFVPVVLRFLPWSVGRPLFLISGPTYALGIYCLGQWMKRDYDSIALRLAILMNVIAGAVNGAMAAVQSLNSAVIFPKIEATTDAALIAQYKTAFLATNNTQLGLDIAWDVWVNFGTIAFAFAIMRHFAFRPWVGILGMLIPAASLVNNMIAFPMPPATTGSIDLGPFIGAWWGVLLIVVIVQYMKDKKSQKAA